MSEEGYNGWTNWDTWNTWLILTNDRMPYEWLMAWNKNFRRKIKRGVFNMIQAEKVVEKYLIPAARGRGRGQDFMRYSRDYVPDPEINPKLVNKREIVEAIIDLDK